MDEARRRLLRRLFVGELSVRRFVGSAVFIYGSLAVFAHFGSDRLIFQPHPPGYSLGPDVLTIDAGGVKVAARYLESQGARYTMLVSHGNAEDLGDLGGLLARLRAIGVNVLAYDYEGYGASEGAASEARVYADIDAAYTYLTTERGVAPGRIIAYGRSLGGAAAVDLASRRPIGGLILESTFTSAFRVITRVPLFPGDKLRNLAKMPQVRCPVLVMHGKRDSLISIEHGEALFHAAPGLKLSLWVDGADHADVPFVAGREYEAAVLELLRLGEAS
jgi:fermentation-respiration switch protein FrsA (DUF1100 family)